MEIVSELNSDDEDELDSQSDNSDEDEDDDSDDDDGGGTCLPSSFMTDCSYIMLRCGV
jgi:hypothetical protein